MNKLNKLFSEESRELLSLYFTAGFPNLDDTSAVLRTLLKNDGVDLIELGFPFSDPLADGPVIQHSNERALANGMSLAVLFAQLKAMRGEIAASSKPVLLMGYFNPVLQFGVERFCTEAAAAGISGVILPDLPVELYAAQYRAVFTRYNLAFVPLVTPDTPEARLRWIDEQTNGFLYLVSGHGTTGSNTGVDTEKASRLAGIAALDLQHPLMIGFGIHDRTSFAAACRHAAGAIIGTAFIEALGSGGDDLEKTVAAFVESIRAEAVAAV